ncbi:MAG: NYN domain-containing protein, partial [Erysipelotrichaceae bacterium]|nr:NYN domain-containing protein [Erysipelotrichaceae bacterium]
MEDPNLNINYDGKQINVSIMGEVQIEVLKKLIKERFGYDVEFSDAKINYMETISAPIEGVGHYEPLRHYGEVHLLLEPISKGVEICNGIDNTNDMHYQKVIMNFLESIELKGILTNSPLTNIRITLLAFKSHLKHSEPADFLECCKRAIRHALKRADNILLEPYYHFEIIINNNYVSKVLYDLDNFNAEYEISNIDNELVKIIGSASVAKMQNYNIKFLSLTSGMGKISMNIDGYCPCLEQDKIIEEIAYDDESDIDNPSGSIFCAHGAGFYVNYEDVENYMHIPYVYLPKTAEQKAFHNKMSISDDELKRVWNNTYKPKEISKAKNEKKEVKDYYDIKETKPKCLLVDGYNVIFGWSDLKQMAAKNLDMARNRLIDHMSEYQAYRYDLVIVVFDAYKTEAVMENIIENKNVVIVYTKNKQTADTYIEKTVAKLTKDYVVSVATSDSLEQLTVMTQNAIRISSSELEKDYHFMKKMIHDRLQKNRTTFYNHSLKDIIKYLE